jgi:ribonuclease Z
MAEVILLGTGAAIPSPGRDNTMLVLDDGTELTLIDASGAPTRRLAEAGLGQRFLSRVIITHQHLDHTYGLPSLLQALWLDGRREPLPIYALPVTWSFLERLIDAFRPSSWTDGFPIERHDIPDVGGEFLETSSWSCRAALSSHSVPSVGLRFNFASGSSVVYTADTSPSEAITELSRAADILIHECTFQAGQEEEALKLGHSTARHAAQTARDAHARRLLLIHFTPTADGDLDQLRSQASVVFAGPVETPGDLDRVQIS